MKLYILLALSVLSLMGQAKDTSPRYLGSYTVATLPSAASWSGYVAVVTDASFAGSCTSGSGSAKSLCISNGSAWGSLGGSSLTAGATGALTISSGVIDIDTAYVPSKTNLYAVTGRGAFASLPTCNSTAAVRLYKFTDSFYEDAHCDGSTWAYFRDGMSMTQPSGLSATSGTTATTSTTNGGIAITLSNTNRVEAFTAASNFSGATKTATSCWIPTINLTGQYYEVGIVLRESATSKHVLWTTFVQTNKLIMNRAQWTTASSWSSNNTVDSGYLNGTLVCARVRKASSNLYFDIGDGINWTQLATTALTAFFTTDADEAGIGGVANGSLVPVYGSFIHWSVQ